MPPFLRTKFGGSADAEPLNGANEHSVFCGATTDGASSHEVILEFIDSVRCHCAYIKACDGAV